MAKKPTNSKINTQKYSEKSTLKTNFLYKIDQRVKYVGGMHDEYKNCECVIKSRANKNHRIDYSVQFDDEKIVNYIIEKALEEIKKEVENDRVIESEDSINENNQTIL